MTLRSSTTDLSARPPLADGLRALRLTVLAFMLVDIVSTLIWQAYGVVELGPAGPLVVVQMLCVVAAAAAVMWHRSRVAMVSIVMVAGLVFAYGPSGQEDWLLAISGVVAGARAPRRLLVVVVLGQLAYALVFALNVERGHPGWGVPSGLITAGVALVALGAGLVARVLLRSRDRRRRRVAELEQQRTEIRAAERSALADDLQAVITRGLATVSDRVEAVSRRLADLAALRAGMEQIDLDSRAVLAELRALLEVLRRDLPAAPEHVAGVALTGPRRWIALLTSRHIRIAASAVFALLALRVGLGGFGPAPGPELAVTAIGLVAAGLAVWWPRIGAGVAVAALALAQVADLTAPWDAVPVALLCLLTTLRTGPRRFFLVVAGLAGYGGLVALVRSSEATGQLVTIWYVGLIAIVIGLAASHFHTAWRESLRQLDDLLRERDRVGSEERTAVARELHDMVAYQLSATSMLVLASTGSDDPAELGQILEKIRGCTDNARHELSALLLAMRRPSSEHLEPTPLVSPGITAGVLAERLADSGFHPVVEIDPGADRLDATTQRTLSRIMQEAASNILRYTTPGGTCRYELGMLGDGVRLQVVSPMMTHQRRSDLSLGWGLRGIRERVDLTHGTFSAGPEHGHWVLAVTLPATLTPRPGGAGSSGQPLTV